MTKSLLALTAAAAGAVALARADEMLLSTYKGTKGLNDLAKASGKYMGTATDQFTLDTAYLKALENTADWGFLTPGNAMKWDSTEYSQNSFQWAKGDAIVAEAKKLGAKLRCHTLVWYQQTPQWVQSLAKDAMLSALENHITQVMTHFGANCSHWDVLNEALAEDGTYRKSFWYEKTGTEYIKRAFLTASAVKKKLGLEVELFYNDYNTDRVNGKSTGALTNIVKFLQDADIEINGVGFQAHLTAGQVATKADQITNMKRFTDLGLKVAITELDIKVGSTSPSTATQKQQATDYQTTIEACKELDGCLGVTIWDFSDQWSWITNDAPLPMYQPKGKNTEVVRKAAYDAIAAGWGTSGGSGSAGSTSPAATTTSPTATTSSPATTKPSTTAPATVTTKPSSTTSSPATTSPAATTSAPATTSPAATSSPSVAPEASTACRRKTT